jgi:transcriptional regulator with XRE-family HTH domain
MMTLKQIEDSASKAGITMRELCQRAGIAYTTYWRWSSGKSEPKLSKLEKLIQAAKGVMP